MVYTYIEQIELLKEIEEKLRIQYKKVSVLYAITLYRLGGIDKSQLALNYAEKYKDRYNPILWIDAIDGKAIQSSFKRCIAELKLPKKRIENQ